MNRCILIICCWGFVACSGSVTLIWLCLKRFTTHILLFKDLVVKRCVSSCFSGYSARSGVCQVHRKDRVEHPHGERQETRHRARRDVRRVHGAPKARHGGREVITNAVTLTLLLKSGVQSLLLIGRISGG